MEKIAILFLIIFTAKDFAVRATVSDFSVAERNFSSSCVRTKIFE